MIFDFFPYLISSFPSLSLFHFPPVPLSHLAFFFLAHLFLISLFLSVFLFLSFFLVLCLFPFLFYSSASLYFLLLCLLSLSPFIPLLLLLLFPLPLLVSSSPFSSSSSSSDLVPTDLVSAAPLSHLLSLLLLHLVVWSRVSFLFCFPGSEDLPWARPTHLRPLWPGAYGRVEGSEGCLGR